MRALSIKQPWLYAITDLNKRIENRTWKPPLLSTKETIALHASKKDDIFGYREIYRITGIQVSSELPRGCIVATARITGCWIGDGNHYQDDDKWFVGPYGWIIEDVKKLPVPIFCKGALGLWTVPQKVERMINMVVEL